jgi:hypothetical protein
MDSDIWQTIQAEVNPSRLDSYITTYPDTHFKDFNNNKNVSQKTLMDT